MKRREEMNFWERIYLVEIVKGLRLTFGRLIRNFMVHLAHRAGTKVDVAAAASIQYPNERRVYPPRFRGRHRLTLYENGDIRCTSCFLCATACPARCIYIEAAEHDDPSVEKFPHRYEIDTLPHGHGPPPGNLRYRSPLLYRGQGDSDAALAHARGARPGRLLRRPHEEDAGSREASLNLLPSTR
jgi:NAD-dependent dihydropyrimidine dehydrogenase PreA subunit